MYSEREERKFNLISMVYAVSANVRNETLNETREGESDIENESMGQQLLSIIMKLRIFDHKVDSSKSIVSYAKW